MRRVTTGRAGRGVSLALAALAAFGVPACAQSGSAPAPAAERADAQPAPPAAATVRIVVLGDSLTAGYGLPIDDSYPAVLARRLTAAGIAAEVVNAGVSGDTTAGGLRRVDWALDGRVDVLIVALGGNDALRGLPVEELKQNLSAIVERAQARRVAVILAGMEAPPNLGRAYTMAFRQAYRDVAAAHHVAFLPFLLEGVAGVPSLNQGDGIHPNAVGARRVAENLWPYVESAARSAVKHD
ncbi:MAG: arylesterase [Acidobacteria bacterium]|nr:arylesterase [Acidobacteriota bacterium]